MALFLSTPSARRATCPPSGRGASVQHFYPRPPRGGRLNPIFEDSVHFLFLSTPSARRATFRHCFPPCCRRISIHALREEGDHADNVPDADYASISIHALREEGD